MQKKEYLDKISKGELLLRIKSYLQFFLYAGIALLLLLCPGVYAYSETDLQGNEGVTVWEEVYSSNNGLLPVAMPKEALEINTTTEVMVDSVPDELELVVNEIPAVLNRAAFMGDGFSVSGTVIDPRGKVQFITLTAGSNPSAIRRWTPDPNIKGITYDKNTGYWQATFKLGDIENGPRSIYIVTQNDMVRRDKTFYVKVDTIAPHIEQLATSHQDEVLKAGDGVSIQVTFSENMEQPQININFPESSIDVEATMSGSGKKWSYCWQVPANIDGKAVLSFSGRDLAGNPLEDGQQLNYTVDNTPPQVVIGEPSSKVTAKGVVHYPVTFSGASFLQLKPEDVLLAATGNVGGKVLVSGEGLAQRNISIQEITGDGTLQVGLRAGIAADAVGNLSASALGAEIIVDNTPPLASLAGLTEGWHNGDQTFTMTGEDSGSGISHYEYKIDQGQWQRIELPCRPVTARSESGISILSVRAVDLAGNESKVISKEVKVDKTDPQPPNLNLVEDCSKHPRFFTISEGRDDHSGVAGYQCKLGDGEWSGIYAGSEKLALGETGQVIIQARTVDRVGRTSTVVSKTARVDMTPPVITLLGEAELHIKKGTVYVEPGAAAEDNWDGSLTTEILITGQVNSAVPGTYTLLYNVRDRQGNNAAEVSRRVVVEAEASSGPSNARSSGEGKKQETQVTVNSDKLAALNNLWLINPTMLAESGWLNKISFWLGNFWGQTPVKIVE